MQLVSEYDPQPSFGTGTPAKAPKGAVMLTSILTGFQNAARAAVLKSRS